MDSQLYKLSDMAEAILQLKLTDYQNASEIISDVKAIEAFLSDNTIESPSVEGERRGLIEALARAILYYNKFGILARSEGVELYLILCLFLRRGPAIYRPSTTQETQSQAQTQAQSWKPCKYGPLFSTMSTEALKCSVPGLGGLMMDEVWQRQKYLLALFRCAHRLISQLPKQRPQFKDDCKRSDRYMSNAQYAFNEAAEDVRSRCYVELMDAGWKQTGLLEMEYCYASHYGYEYAGKYIKKRSAKVGRDPTRDDPYLDRIRRVVKYETINFAEPFLTLTDHEHCT